METKAEKLYEEWCGNNRHENDCHPVHDSSEVIEFAEYYYKKMISKQLESKALNIANVSNYFFNEEINKLAIEKYPIKMIATGNVHNEWDINEQYRECWIDGYKSFLNDC